MNKIRVIHVIGTLKTGGAENIALNFFRYADKNNFEMDYLVYDQDETLYTKEVEELGGRVIRCVDITTNRFKIEKKLRDIFLKYGPYDVVHSHLLFHNGYVMEAAVRAKIPIRISHSHSTNDGKNNSIITAIYHIIMRRYIKKNATCLCACGNKAGIYLYGKRTFKNRGEVLNNKIDINRFCYTDQRRAKYRKELGWDNDEKKIGIFVGHLIPVKNVNFIIEIFNELNKISNRHSFYIIGEGALRNDLEKKTRKMGLNNINFEGNKDNVYKYMISADYLIMPSLYEGLPVTLIEAQSSGLPCFISNNITDEVVITEDVKKISLLMDASYWAKVIDNYHQNTKRKNSAAVMKKKGYDISDYNSWIYRNYCKNKSESNVKN